MKRQVKICGIRYVEDLRAICDFNQDIPDYLGFIFYERSARFMEDSIKPADLNIVPDSIQRVGVFVNASNSYISKQIEDYGLHAVQLHGNESPDQLKELKVSIADDLLIIKAFGIDECFDWTVLKDYQDSSSSFLFDTKSAKYGGTGKVFNHDLLENYKLDHPFFLSGGIGPENLDEVLRSNDKRFQVVDLNSKLEQEPARKDIQLVRSAILKVRSYE